MTTPSQAPIIAHIPSTISGWLGAQGLNPATARLDAIEATRARIAALDARLVRAQAVYDDNPADWTDDDAGLFDSVMADWIAAVDELAKLEKRVD